MDQKILDGYITEREYAAQQDKTLRWAQKQRQHRLGPPFLKIGKQVYYSLDSVREYLKAIEQVQPRALKSPR